MSYIGAGISRFNTADELTVTGDATIDTTTLVVDSTNNNVGIGTASPEDFGGGYTTLEVAGSSTANGGIFKTATSDSAGTGTAGTEMLMYSNNGGGVIAVTSSDPLLFQTAGAERMRLTSAGLLGVNTTSPSAQVDVRTAALGTALQLSDNTNYGVNFIGVSGGLRMKMNGAQTLTIDQANNANVFHINGSGNVGIGTASPSDALHIKTTADADIGLQVQNDDTQAFCKVQSGGTALYGGNGGVNFVSGSGFATRMHIASGGNVGIGTSSPGVLLDVKSSGQAAFGIGSTNAGGAILYLDGDSNGDYSGTDYSFIRHDTNGRLDIVQHSPSGTNQLRFYTGNTERARFDTSGQFRLNATQNQVTGYELFTCNGAAGFRNGDASVVGVWQTQTSAFAMQFFSGSAGNNVGSISVTANSTAFNTSSDRRLKSNIEDAASASDKIDAIQVRQFDWNVDDSHQDYGLIAQELQPIEPLAVTGDADSDKMMAVDYSKLVPMLIKEIQELRSRVAALEE